MIIYLIILLAVAARFVPHMPNFAPITALAIFSAAHLGWKKSVGLTLAARFVSDLFLGFFAWPLMLVVYASHLFGVALGLWIKKSGNVMPSGSPDGGEPRNLLSDRSKYRQGGTLPLRWRCGRDDKAKWLKIGASGVLASAVFFLVTNFAFFYAGYPHNWSGIIESYTSGLPFLRGTLIGDTGYTLALFAGYEAALALFKGRINLTTWLRA